MPLSTFLHRFLCGCVFVCLGSGVAGSCDNSLFSHLRNCQIALLSIYYFTFTGWRFQFSTISARTFRQCFKPCLPCHLPVTTEAPAGFCDISVFLTGWYWFLLIYWPSPLQNRVLSFSPILFISHICIFFSPYPFALISMRFQDVLEVSSCVQSASLNWKFLQFLLY